MIEWVERFKSALEEEGVRAALDVLSTRSTGHADTPKKVDKVQALEAIMESVDTAESQYKLAVSLSREPEPVAQDLAAKYTARSRKAEWGVPLST